MVSGRVVVPGAVVVVPGAVVVVEGSTGPVEVGSVPVDDALASTRTTQQRLRELPSRVVVYLLIAAGLFAELGYCQVWARLVAGLDGIPVAAPSSSALAQARRRVGPAPLAAVFRLLAGPAAGAARWRTLLVCAIDSTTMFVPDSPANLTRFPYQGGGNGPSGYPMLRLMAVVAAPLMEELVFRVTLFGGTRRLLDNLSQAQGWRHPAAWIAMAVSVAAFVLAHGVWGWTVGILPLTLLSVILTLLYAHTKSIWPGVLYHALHNAFVVTMQFYVLR